VLIKFLWNLYRKLWRVEKLGYIFDVYLLTVWQVCVLNALGMAWLFSLQKNCRLCCALVRQARKQMCHDCFVLTWKNVFVGWNISTHTSTFIDISTLWQIVSSVCSLHHAVFVQCCAWFVACKLSHVIGCLCVWVKMWLV